MSTVDDRVWQDQAFTTAGPTGEPITWLRGQDQLRAEAAILAELCATRMADGIVCYASPKLLYGYLMGVALPELTRLPCRFPAVTAPLSSAFVGLNRPLVAAVPAATAAMARGLSALRRLHWLTLVHGSGSVHPATTEVVNALRGRSMLVEMSGSTETGLVGWRSRRTDDWRAAPDVTLDREPDGRLRVTGPRIARRIGEPPWPGEVRQTVLDDLVTVNPDRTFRLLGRASRLIKVNGVGVHLDRVEAQLRAAVPRASLWCRAESDPVRGEWFSVVVASAEQVDAVRAASRVLPVAARPTTVGVA